MVFGRLLLAFYVLEAANIPLLSCSGILNPQHLLSVFWFPLWRFSQQQCFLPALRSNDTSVTQEIDSTLYFWGGWMGRGRVLLMTNGCWGKEEGRNMFLIHPSKNHRNKILSTLYWVCLFSCKASWNGINMRRKFNIQSHKPVIFLHNLWSSHILENLAMSHPIHSVALSNRTCYCYPLLLSCFFFSIFLPPAFLWEFWRSTRTNTKLWAKFCLPFSRYSVMTKTQIFSPFQFSCKGQSELLFCVQGSLVLLHPQSPFTPSI